MAHLFIRQDIGLLLLRLGLGLPMLVHHGMPYLTHFDEEAARFLQLFGLDSGTILVLAVVVEVGAAAFMVMGLFTRLASLLLAVTMAVAFVMVHGARFDGEQSGELAFLYLVGSTGLCIMGSGRFAWDHHSSG
jgi:putative oxidoreductase